MDLVLRKESGDVPVAEISKTFTWLPVFIKNLE
jgi:hypothetical protein